MGKRAFTLVELLVIVAIVVVLAMVLFPVFANAKNAKQSDSLTHIHQISHASQLYSADYDGNFVIMSQDYFDSACGVPGTNDTLVCLDDLPVATPVWDLLLVPYLKTIGTLIDPATGDPQGYFGTGPQANSGISKFSSSVRLQL
jgi:type II secretory pathway pseudopilin PulG